MHLELMYKDVHHILYPRPRDSTLSDCPHEIRLGGFVFSFPPSPVPCRHFCSGICHVSSRLGGTIPGQDGRTARRDLSSQPLPTPVPSADELHMHAKRHAQPAVRMALCRCRA